MGALTGWGAGFDPRGGVRELSFSSLGVYVAGGPEPGHLWGLDAATGRVLFDCPGFVSAVAASSGLIYVGGTGFQRPVWAVNPFTGADTDWAPGLTFEYIPATYGWDATQVGDLLLDSGRLYIAGRFRTADGRASLTAVEAVGGRAVGWWPATPGPGNSEAALFRVGPAIVANLGGASFGGSQSIVAFDVTTAATIPFEPDVVGAVLAVAAAPEGVVVGGSFNGSGGVDRAGSLASLDLDTGEIEPWTSVGAGAARFDPIVELATDGTWLFARSEGTLNGNDARFFKIDAGDRRRRRRAGLPVRSPTRMRVAGGEIVVSTLAREHQRSQLNWASSRSPTWSYSRTCR